jgi:RES domain-containing protein
MLVYRIDRQKRKDQVLSGFGAEMYGGRWNFPGTRAVYTAGSRSLSMLEMLVHLDLTYQMPKDRIMCTLHIPDTVTIHELELPLDWDKTPYGSSTQSLFPDFAMDRTKTVLKVPSAVIPEEHNFILNPLAEDFYKIKVEHIKEIELSRFGAYSLR